MGKQMTRCSSHERVERWYKKREGGEVPGESSAGDVMKCRGLGAGASMER